MSKLWREGLSPPKHEGKVKGRENDECRAEKADYEAYFDILDVSVIQNVAKNDRYTLD